MSGGRRPSTGSEWQPFYKSEELGVDNRRVVVSEVKILKPAGKPEPDAGSVAHVDPVSAGTQVNIRLRHHRLSQGWRDALVQGRVDRGVYTLMISPGSAPGDDEGQSSGDLRDHKKATL
jgi:hypothetical protein